MIRPHVFDYLIFVLAPLITFFCSKIEMFAHQSEYVVVTQGTIASSIALLRTNYMEIYVNYKLALAFTISITALCLAHIIYCAAAFWKCSSHVRRSWPSEGGTSRAPTAPTALRRCIKISTSWPEVRKPYRSGGQDHLADPVTTFSLTGQGSRGSVYDGVEMEDLGKLTPDPMRASLSPMPHHDRASLHDKDENDDDDGDWKSVYCKEWTSTMENETGGSFE